MENKKSNYAVVIAIACCLIVFGGAGTVFSTAGIFYTVVADAFGVGKGTFSLYMTIVCLVMSFSLPVLGKLLVKMDIRKVMALDGLCIAVSWVLFATSQHIWVFYIAAAIQGFGVAGPMYSLVPTMTSRWFQKKNGMVIGIAMAFTGIAGIILQPVLGSVITNMGWRAGYWVNAVLSAVLVIIPSLLMLRSNPSDIGQVPYGYEEITETAEAAEAPAMTGVPMGPAMKSASFACLLVLAGMINMYTCVNFYWASFATSIGFPLTIAATISSAAMYGQLVGKIGLGSLSDKNLNLGLICAYSVGAIGLILALVLGGSGSVALIVACVFLYGVTHGSCAVETPIVAKECFGNGKDYAQIYSNIASVGSFCSAIGSTLFGYIIDWTGSYVPVFVLGIGMSVISFIMARVAIAKSKTLPRE